MPVLQSGDTSFLNRIELRFGDDLPDSLLELAKGVATYHSQPEQIELKTIGDATLAMIEKDPITAEILGKSWLDDFMKELNTALLDAGKKPMRPPKPGFRMNVSAHNKKPVNRHKQIKKKLRAAQEAVNLTAPIASSASAGAGGPAFAVGASTLIGSAGTPTVVACGTAFAAGSVATAGALPLAVGGALMIGETAVSGRAAVSSICKRHSLQSVQRHRKTEFYRCNPILAEDYRLGEHEYISEITLPYIIRQKGKKAITRGIQAIPAGVLLTGTWGLARRVRKWSNGTRGKDRKMHAEVLARHFISHDCDLCFAMMCVLFGDEKKAFWLRDQTFEVVNEAVLPKLASK